MPNTDLTTRDLKLVQYLTEAYGKERQLETALQAHISMTERPAYKKRLQQHLRETKAHAKDVERRIKKLGAPVPEIAVEAATTASGLIGKAAALAQGPIHALRGTGEEEKELKNAKDEYAEEAQEIAMYTAIESLATEVGDTDTAKLAKKILRDEERMAKYLERTIPVLAKAVAKQEIPASERSHGTRRRSSTRGRSTRSRGTRSRNTRARSRSSYAASRSACISRRRARCSSARSSICRTRSGETPSCWPTFVSGWGLRSPLSP
jgi:ferritin-like metal-binding protein YciE